MIHRRDFFGAAGLTFAAGMSSLARAAATAPRIWAPYRRALAIDGRGGSGLFYMEASDPLPGELRAIQRPPWRSASGAIAAYLPQGACRAEAALVQGVQRYRPADGMGVRGRRSCVPCRLLRF